jgi:hypothetical protein
MTSNNGRGAIAENRFAQTGLTCWFRPLAALALNFTGFDPLLPLVVARSGFPTHL